MANSQFSQELMFFRLLPSRNARTDHRSENSHALSIFTTTSRLDRADAAAYPSRSSPNITAAIVSAGLRQNASADRAHKPNFQLFIVGRAAEPQDVLMDPIRLARTITIASVQECLWSVLRNRKRLSRFWIRAKSPEDRRIFAEVLFQGFDPVLIIRMI